MKSAEQLVQFESTDVLSSDQILINIDCKYGHFVVCFLLYISGCFRVGVDEMSAYLQTPYRVPSFLSASPTYLLANVLVVSYFTVLVHL